MIKRYLDDLEARIDGETEILLWGEWLDFVEGKFTCELFMPYRKRKSFPKVKWPEILINDSLEDYDKMALQQFAECSKSLEKGDGGILCVRCNYGMSIIPSILGAEVFFMEDRYNTLPTSKPVSGGTDALRKIINRGVPDLYRGFGGKVLEMGERFVEIMKNYPKIKKHVHIYHPDLQGPMDICEIIVGSELFLLIMDEPALVHDLLTVVTETYVAFMKEWLKIVPYNGLYSVHWSMLHKGCIMLRDDSAMNLSPNHFEEFIKPYDQRLLTQFGGGAVHFCGRGDHYIKNAVEMNGLYAVNMSQPQYNDMNVIYRALFKKGIKLIGFSEEYARRALEEGINFQSSVHCWPQ